MYFDQELDARNLVFPLPIWKTEQAITQMSIGQVLKLTTGCNIAKHVQQFADQTGNILLSKSEVNGMCIFYLQKNTANYRHSKSRHSLNA